MMIYHYDSNKCSLIITICMICFFHNTYSYPNIITNGTTFSTTAKSTYQNERSTETENLSNIGTTLATTTNRDVHNEEESDDVIQKAIYSGIFINKTEWFKKQGTSAGVTEDTNADNYVSSNIVKRTTSENSRSYTVSDSEYYLTGYETTSINIESESHTKISDTIYFPGDIHNKIAEHIPSSNICKGGSICADVPNYPEQLIKNALKKYKGELHSTNDEIDSEFDVGQRFGTDQIYQFCTKRISKIQPRVGITREGDARYIVNVKNLTQMIVLEQCVNVETECNFISGGVVLGYKPYCVQKHIYRDLYSLQPDGSSIHLESFRIPASCCCELRAEDNGKKRP